MRNTVNDISDIQVLEDKIREAFREVPPPEPGAMIEEAYGEDWVAFAKELQKYTWANLDAEFAEANCQEFIYLMPLAFTYFLPGLMLLSLKDCHTDFSGTLVWFVVRSLALEAGSDMSRSVVTERLSLVNNEQLCAIRDFLAFLLPYEEFDHDRPDMRNTLKLLNERITP